VPTVKQRTNEHLRNVQGLVQLKRTPNQYENKDY